MAPAPLATTDDLDDRGIAWDNQILAETYLAVASAAVRDAAGCPISAQTSTLQLYGDGGPWLRLPGQPVRSITSVTFNGKTLVAGTDYQLIDGSLYRPWGWEVCAPLPKPVTVVLAHGLLEAPADVVDLVCRMAGTAIWLAGAEDDGSGLTVDRPSSERIGDYSVTYDRESGSTEMELAARTRARLAARFGSGAAMVTTR